MGPTSSAGASTVDRYWHFSRRRPPVSHPHASVGGPQDLGLLLAYRWSAQKSRHAQRRLHWRPRISHALAVPAVGCRLNC